MLALDTHLGMGDAILQNGLVRFLARDQDILFPAKPEYMRSVSFMFRDNPRIHVVDGNTDLPEPRIRLGWKGEHFVEGCNFDESFYRQAGVDFRHRRDSFRVDRDRRSEIKAGFKRYAFLHDKPGMEIDRERVNGSLTVLKPSGRPNIFDYCSMIENAAEVHCMDSAFACLCECMGLGRGRRFYHAYSRPMESKFGITLSKDWIVL